MLVDICVSIGIITSSETVIRSPGYSDSNYPNNQNCEKIVRFEEGTSIQMEFVGAFYLEHHASCKYDFIEIRNGETDDSPSIMKVCGSTKPQITISQGSSVWMKFKSDAYSNGQGFALKVSQVTRPKCKRKLSIFIDY